MPTVRFLAALAMFSWSAVLVSGCGSKSDDEAEAAVDKVDAFENRMCACRDRDCAMMVNNELTAWGAEIASRHPASQPITEAMTKRMTAVAAVYSECMTSAMRQAVVPVDAPPAAPPPADTDVPLPEAMPLDIDKAIRSAINWGKAHRDSDVASIKYEYIDAAGTLDRDFGALHVEFGYSSENDPKRRVGAPIYLPKFHAKCFTLSLRAGSWTRDDNTPCSPVLVKPPACRVRAIWAEAIAKGAPKDAVATIDLWSDPPRWRVAVKDKPRKIDFREDFPDDCPVTVEAEPK
jgi:hypothetical protein